MTEATPNPVRKALQCKHIADRPVLEFLASLNGRWGASYSDWPTGVGIAMLPGIPHKLIVAKMNMLIRRGLVDGCTCGCRGDYELTPKGKAFIVSAQS